MKILQLPPISDFQTNCYLVVCENNDAVLIDAADDADFIMNFAKNNNCIIKKILLTHGHCDHIAAVEEIYRKTNCEIVIHKADAKKFQNPVENLTAYFGLPEINVKLPLTEVCDGDKVALNELTFDVIHTPGHTSGCVCYVCGGAMFCGDALFRLSIGRTDMPDGDMDTYVNTLKKFCKMEENYDVYAGHMEKTTLDFERKFNPYLKQLAKEI